jgi:dihydropteroate synthase
VNLPVMRQKLSIKIMGVLNVTPDSFSDGGRFFSPEAALEQAEKLIGDGADILDIGGESTRPYADPVGTEEELNRVIPVIRAIRQKYSTPISIDTYKATVAREALDAGADIINDVTALRKDPELIEVARQSGAPVIIMHMQGTPADMQVKPEYRDVVGEIYRFFEERIEAITSAGIPRERITVDPGIGFGKTLEHNLSILKHLDTFTGLGVPLMLAHSRKRFLGELTQLPVGADRDFATAVVAALSSHQGIHLVRVHDVASTRQALLIAEAIRSAS